ncbi:MAG TPA: metallophosphoesterase family protein [Vicinamibacterales bacterium]|nr:metallophosphoesterase family protein [Vicinamibacterales bacterium]
MTRIRFGFLLLLVAVLGWTAQPTTTDTTFVTKGAVWKYFDLGASPGSGWNTLAFNDAAWPSGAAPLGYGDGDEATVVGYGPDPNAKYTTTYFRRTFTVSDPSLYQGLTVNVLRDDGAVVYINGTEVFRSNMPGGGIAYGTFATTAVTGADESTTFYSGSVNPSVLRAGTNLMAVEIHQSGGTSSDISFNAELIGSTGLQLTRGPYLQMGTPSSIVVRWRTGAASDSAVMYGPAPGSLIWSATSAAVTTEHEVTLSNLDPATTYYYSVGSTTQTLAGDASHHFVTSPPAGTAQPARVWVLGDSGTADANARAVRDAFYGVNGGSAWANLWLMLGDNAYNSGTDAEFQSAVFDMYPVTLRQSVLWPTIGNHDGASADSATGTGPYYDVFTLPKSAQAGGLASGTEAYYSFDYGNIHFICLDSFETSRAVNGPMLTWLQNDLAATTQKWIVAFWHHPPYSKGSHDSDTDTAMSEMRQNALPVLEAGGVDLVLAGHSHSYER